MAVDVLTCSCGAKLRVPPGADAPGRLFRCPRCQANVAVPGAGAAAPPAGSGRSAGNCPICQAAIQPSDQYVTCPSCDQVHHRECWLEIGGCSTYGCEKAPALNKEEGAQAPMTAWGDIKSCPACGEKIKSIALRCRYCGTDFHTVDPLTAGDLRRGVHKEKEIKDLRTNIVVLFVITLTGCLAPLAILISPFYIMSKRDMLPKAGPVHQVLAYFTIGLSALYTLLLIFFVLKQ